MARWPKWKKSAQADFDDVAAGFNRRVLGGRQPSRAVPAEPDLPSPAWFGLGRVAGRFAPSPVPPVETDGHIVDARLRGLGRVAIRKNGLGLLARCPPVPPVETDGHIVDARLRGPGRVAIRKNGLGLLARCPPVSPVEIDGHIVDARLRGLGRVTIRKNGLGLLARCPPVPPVETGGYIVEARLRGLVEAQS